MRSEAMKAALAPCGLSCETCFAHVDGDIRKYSSQLRERLGNFEAYAARFENLLEEPVFAHYPAFQQVLDYFAAENCQGCRNEQCRLLKTCGVRPCHQEKGVEFCYQCGEFPCDRTHFDQDLRAAWVRINTKIRTIGIEVYCERTKHSPRYR